MRSVEEASAAEEEEAEVVEEWEVRAVKPSPGAEVRRRYESCSRSRSSRYARSSGCGRGERLGVLKAKVGSKWGRRGGVEVPSPVRAK